MEVDLVSNFADINKFLDKNKACKNLNKNNLDKLIKLFGNFSININENIASYIDAEFKHSRKYDAIKLGLGSFFKNIYYFFPRLIKYFITKNNAIKDYDNLSFFDTEIMKYEFTLNSFVLRYGRIKDPNLIKGYKAKYFKLFDEYEKVKKG